MELEQRLTVGTREAKEATDVKGSVNSKLEELTSMTKDGAKRVKELEKEKKLLEQRNSQFEKTISTLEARTASLATDLSSKEKVAVEAETKAEKLEQSKRSLQIVVTDSKNAFSDLEASLKTAKQSCEHLTEKVAQLTREKSE